MTEPGRQDDLSLKVYLYSHVYKDAFKCVMKLDLTRDSMSSASQNFVIVLDATAIPGMRVPDQMILLLIA